MQILSKYHGKITNLIKVSQKKVEFHQRIAIKKKKCRSTIKTILPQYLNKDVTFIKWSRNKDEFHLKIMEKFGFRQWNVENTRICHWKMEGKKEILSKNHSKNAIFIQRLQKKHKLCQTICGKKCDIRQKIMRKTRISLRDHNKNVNFVTGLLLKYEFRHRIVVKCQFLQKITKKILWKISKKF